MYSSSCNTAWSIVGAQLIHVEWKTTWILFPWWCYSLMQCQELKTWKSFHQFLLWGFALDLHLWERQKPQSLKENFHCVLSLLQLSEQTAHPRSFLEWVSPPLNFPWLFPLPAWLLVTELSSATWPHRVCPFYSKKSVVTSCAQLVSVRFQTEHIWSWWMTPQVIFWWARLILTQNNKLYTALAL